VLGLSIGAVAGNALNLANLGHSLYAARRVVARVHDSDGNVLAVRARDAQEIVMLPPTAREPWGLRVVYRAPADRAVPWWRYGNDQEQADLRGRDAIRAAAQLLPRFNARGASSRRVKSAVALATEFEDPSTAFDQAARIAASKRTWGIFSEGARLPAKLSTVPAEVRLALEMISHEEAERRALEGELYLLEDAWKEAEEIAAISDDMFLPEDISNRLSDMKKGR
jgi:hypothetical protein